MLSLDGGFAQAIALLIIGVIIYALSRVPQIPAGLNTALYWIGIILMVVAIILMVLAILGIALFIIPYTLSL